MLEGDQCVQPSFIRVGSFSAAVHLTFSVLEIKTLHLKQSLSVKTCIDFHIYFENFTFTPPSILPPSTPKCMPARSSIRLCYQCYQSTMLAVSSAHRMPNEVLIDDHTHASV